MKKRVLLLTQWFEPEPTFKGLVFARELVARGYEVEVVTGFPNYPGGVIYPGWKMSWRRHENIEGVEVTRVALYPSHDASPIRRIANYASFAASALLYCLFSARRADVVYCYQLLTVGVVAALVKAIRGSRVVFDIQDVWPDTLRATGMISSERVIGAVGRAALLVYSRMDAIVVLSPGFRKLLIDRGVPQEKVEVIYNWSDERALEQGGADLPEGFPQADKFRIVFAGNMGKAQALGAVLKAASQLQVSEPRISFIFIGGGVESESLRATAAARGLRNVEFLPRVPVTKIGAILRSADALLVHLKDDPLFKITIPGKTQAYMAIGKPMLLAVQGDAAALVTRAQCGVLAEPESAASIASAAERLAALSPAELAAMGDRARAFYRDNLAMSVGVEKFARVFERVTSDDLRPAARGSTAIAA